MAEGPFEKIQKWNGFYSLLMLIVVTLIEVIKRHKLATVLENNLRKSLIHFASMSRKVLKLDDWSLQQRFIPSLRSLQSFAERSKNLDLTIFNNAASALLSDLRQVLSKTLDARDRCLDIEMDILYMEFVESVFYLDECAIDLDSFPRHKFCEDSHPRPKSVKDLFQLTNQLAGHERQIYLKRLMRTENEFLGVLRALARMGYEVRKIEYELAERQKCTLYELNQRGIHEGLNRFE